MTPVHRSARPQGARSAPGPHDIRLGVAIDLRRVNHPKAAKVTDLDSFKATFGSIGKNDCGGCHEKYRVKKS
jgi:hypothetical protein